MKDNDNTLNNDPAELKVLLDTNVYLWIQDIAAAINVHALDLLDRMPNVSYYFAHCVIQETIQGRQRFIGNAAEMFKHSLKDEMSVNFDGVTDARMLYNAKDGLTKVAVLTKISNIDHAQILLCHNHRSNDLVLVTNDHRMIKNAAAVLDGRLMDFEYFLQYIDDATPAGPLKNEWAKIRDYYKQNGKHTRPKTVRRIDDRKSGV
jgi:hypothetical protein